jgi:putative ABC transport system permease protein
MDERVRSKTLSSVRICSMTFIKGREVLTSKREKAMLNVIGSVLSFSFYEGLLFGLIAVGMYITFRMLNFPDLGVEGSFPLGGAVAGILIAKGMNPFLATPVAGAAGLLVGLITATLNTKLRIPALLCGIIMIVALWSINLRIMNGANVSLLREVTLFDQVGHFLGIKSGSIEVELIIALVLAGIAFFALNWFLRTQIGLALRATGDNEQMVRGLGSNTEMNIMVGCCIANGLVALAGATIAQAQGFGDVGMGIGILIMGLAAVIIGDALIRPRGVAGMLLAATGGAFVYRLFITVALRFGMNPADLKLVTGVLVTAALSIPFIRKKLRHEWIPPASRLF